MTLPANHQWYNKAPTVSEKYLPYLVIGSSNHAVGAQSATIDPHYNTSRNFIYKHNDTLTGFADAPNNQSVTTYSRLDETGTQNYTSFLSERLRELTDKKVCAITAGQSATGISNQTTGYNSTTTLAQTTALIGAAKTKASSGLKFACVGVSDGDMVFNITDQQIEDLITGYIVNLRAAAGDINLPIFLVCPSLEPTTPAIAANYPTWSNHNTVLKAINISNVFIVDSDSLPVATYRESDEIHYNAAGNKARAGLIFDALVSSGIVL